MNFHYICDMLVDQDRYIGKDPVGYKCSNVASYELSIGLLICDSCFDLLRNTPHRINMPKLGGKLIQDKIISLRDYK